MDVDGCPRTGVTVGAGIGEHAHGAVGVLGIAAHEHQVLEIVRKALALAIRLVAASGQDDHLELGGGVGLVAHEEDAVAHTLFAGGPCALCSMASKRDQHSCRQHEVPPTAHARKLPELTVPTAGLRRQL